MAENSIVFNGRHQRALAAFAIGTIFASFLALVPEVHDAVRALGNLGLVGALISGVLYSNALTASGVTLLLAGLPHSYPPVLLAIAGGVGGALYDFSWYLFVRYELNHHADGLLGRFFHRRRMSPWVTTPLGVLILASPLPDELAAGLMSALRMPRWGFIALSFIANTAGIFAILALA